MKFAIRDDDISYHTDVNILRYLYEDISKVCPISFSCIPYVGGYDIESFTPDKWSQFDVQWIKWQTSEIYPIDKNKELISSLREWCDNDRASIMLHGIHHDLFEFTQDKDFSNEIGGAKKYLEGLFKRRVCVASPPNNSLGVSATLALEENNFNILTAFGHYPNERPFSVKNYLNFARLLHLYFIHGKKKRLTHPLVFENHSEQPCYEIGPMTKYEDLVSGLKFSIKNNGNFVVATHFYHLYDNPNLHTMLKDIVALAKELAPNQVEFVSAENLF